ncbi:heme-dependent protein with NO-binding domain [Leptolyngbyaceae cyanobacterium JSC-12]|nr:heme-dependent protein with NO-binding domain [Leptolyngbyaceae cyanobacterium JSC-12]
MYGLVNKAIEDMVCKYFGEATWKEIKQKADLEVDSFISMEGYPDDVTHKLVNAASAVLGLSTSEIMQAFGEFWVKYTAQEGYGEMMEMSGDNLPEFLENLDNLHARVGVIFPQLKPPSFDCTHQGEESLRLHYHSSREGLAPMVIGLVKGLGTRFDTEVEVTQIQSREEGADHDEFSIKYKQSE